MRKLILTTTLLVALLCPISLPSATVGLPKKPWTKPSELVVGHHHHKGYGRLVDSKVGWTTSSASDSNVPLSPPRLLPGFPNTPWLPNIPYIPIIPILLNIPQIPNIPRIPSVPELPNIPQIPNIPRISNIPELPNIPDLPNIPGLPSLPSLPSLPGLPPLPRVQEDVLSQSAKVEKCLTKDGSKTSGKCFSQILSSWAKKDFALDKECCEFVVNMDKMCNRHVHKLFKDPFFVTLLRYSCHIKHTKN